MILFLNLEPPSPKDALCPVCLKLALWFWKEDFKISSMYFCYFVLEFPSGEVENVKSLRTDRRTNGQMNDVQYVIKKSLEFQLKWPKNGNWHLIFIIFAMHGYLCTLHWNKTTCPVQHLAHMIKINKTTVRPNPMMDRLRPMIVIRERASQLPAPRTSVWLFTF